MDAKLKLRRCSTRDRKIIEHVARYRLTTKETLHQLFFDQNQPNAVTKVTQRLCHEHWLRKYPLVYPSQYLIAGKRTAQALGLPEVRTLPLGPQSLPTEFAVLRYAADARYVNRLTADEIVELHPWYRKELLAPIHCLRLKGERRVVELVRVDLGGPADHVARKCYVDVQVRMAIPEFERLVGDSQFRIVVVTATTDKAAAIQRAVEGRLWPSGMQFHFSIVPQLLPILPRCFDV